MTFEDFTLSLSKPAPPQNIHVILEALWYDGKGNWTSAHNIAQSQEGSPDYDRLHAYLHRAEDDEWNAGYWYRRAGVSVFKGSLQEEWMYLVKQFL